jgi:hypothetical protein
VSDGVVVAHVSQHTHTHTQAYILSIHIRTKTKKDASKAMQTVLRGDDERRVAILITHIDGETCAQQRLHFLQSIVAAEAKELQNVILRWDEATRRGGVRRACPSLPVKVLGRVAL